MNTVLLLTLAAAILCVPVCRRRSVASWYVLWFVVLLFVDQCVTRGMLLPEFPRIDNDWNWTGKVLSILVSSAAILALRNKHAIDFAIRLPTRGSLKPVLTVIVALLALGTGVFWATSPAGDPSLETHLYQLTMPSLAEELAFRGVFLGLLNAAFGRSRRVFGAKMGWGAVVTSVPFGLWHALEFDASMGLSFDPGAMLSLTAAGLVLAWLRERSGSLLVPILFHSLVNELGNVVMLLK
jgi:membrane protease YdiL (CAAX protease family)